MVSPGRTPCSVIAFLSTVILNLLQVVDARTVKKPPFKLLLTSIHTADLAFSLIFTLVFVLYALSAAGKLGNTHKVLPSGRRGEAYATGRLYPFILFFAALSLVVFYVLSAVTVVYALNSSKVDVKHLSFSFVAGRSIVLQLTQWFIVCALLVLLFERDRAGWVKGSTRTYMFKLAFDSVLLAAFLSIIIAFNSLESSYGTLSVKQEWDTLYLGRAYLAFNVILTVDVLVSAVWTWLRLKHRSLPDSIMIGQIVKFISPLLLLQTIYEIAQYAISSSITRVVQVGTLDALFLARLLVTGITNIIILWFAL